MLDSGCTSHMTGSKEIITEMRPNHDNITVSYGDKSKSQVLGLGKVVVAHDISLVDVMLVETLGYNLLSVRALGKMGFAVFIDDDLVVFPEKSTTYRSFSTYPTKATFRDLLHKSTTKSSSMKTAKPILPRARTKSKL